MNKSRQFFSNLNAVIENDRSVPRGILDERRQNLLGIDSAMVKTYRRINPDSCQIWRFIEDIYKEFNEEICRSVIYALESSPDSLPPVIAREVEQDGRKFLEVICHSEIHWVLSNVVSAKGMQMVVDIRNLSDEEAFAVVFQQIPVHSVEQRADWFKRGLSSLFKSKDDMTERLGLSPGFISKILSENQNDSVENEKRYDSGNIVRVNPERCRLWSRHNRMRLDSETCANLIESLSKFGQFVPAIARKINEPDFDYEVVAGGRRLWSLQWMRREVGLDVDILLDVRCMTDMEAFIAANIENKDRDDISQYERAVDYLGAIEDLYQRGDAKKMAHDVGMGYTSFLRLLDLARIPGEIMAAFGDFRVVTIEHAKVLKRYFIGNYTDENSRLLSKASELAILQEDRRANKKKLIPASQVKRILLCAARGENECDFLTKKIQYSDNFGNKISQKKDGSIVIKLGNSIWLSESDMLAILTKTLESAPVMASGRRSDLPKP